MKTKLLLMLSAGMVMLAACKGKYSNAAADTTRIQSTDTVKLVKTAGMRFKVKNVEKTAETINQLTALCGGRVVHHDLQSQIVDKRDIVQPNDSLLKMTVYNSTAEMVIKLPSDFVEGFLDSLNHLGVFVDERKMNIEDRTLDYLSAELKNKNRGKIVQMKSRLNYTKANEADILALKDEIVDKKISNLRTDDSAKFSTLNLSIYQNNTLIKEMVANDDLSLYNVSFLIRLKLALSRGWYYFSELIVLILHFWGFIVAGAIGWAAVAFYKSWKAKKAINLS
jgi:hypothetical protein